jgi:uncharacterized membrane protein
MKYAALGLGEIGAVFYTRVFGIAIMFPGLVVVSRRSGLFPHALDLKRWVFLMAIGLLGALAFMAYVGGLASGSVAIVAPVAASSPAITFILAEVLLKERVRPHQGIGVVMVLAGVIFLSALSLVAT